MCVLTKSKEKYFDPLVPITVQQIKKRAMMFCEEECGQFIIYWNRWSANCAAQIKSKKTIVKLAQAEKNV